MGKLAGGLIAFALINAAQGAPVKIAGPKVVPDTTSFEYRADCPAGGDWTVSALGSPNSGKGRSLVITWGGTPGNATIEVVCGKQTGKLAVEIVEVKIEKTTVTLGGKASPRDDPPLRIVDTTGPPPAVKFTAVVKVTGPTHSPHWGGKITTGFVQRLMSADQAQWQGAYSNNKRPRPDESKLTADTTTNPPPKADCVQLAQDCPSWYAFPSPFTFAPSANSTRKIWINDSPSPGWPNRNPKDRTQLLREAHAIWNFETYVCVQTQDAPGFFFRRAVATWQIEVTYTYPNNATATVTPNLQQMTPDVSADPKQCAAGGMGVNHWLNHVVTFR